MLGMRRIDKIPTMRARDLYGVKKADDKKIDERVLWNFGVIERMENNRIAKKSL